MSNNRDKNLHQLQNNENQQKQKHQSIQNVEIKIKKQKKPCIHWSSKENLRYLAFVISNQADLGIKSSRKVWKIYKLMSQFVQTRDIHQCRSHHQKMIRKHDDIEDLIQQLKLITPQKHLAKSLKEYNQHFLQRPKKTNQNSIKHTLQCQEKKPSHAERKQARQRNQYFNFQDGKKQHQQKLQPIIKLQQDQQNIGNEQNQQFVSNNQFMMPFYNQLMNLHQYCYPVTPYFFIYHQP